MATRLEDRFGVSSAVGQTYVNVVTSDGLWNTLINITNRLSSPVNLRLYIADNSWSTGEPTGGTLIIALAYDMPLDPGQVYQISGNIVKSGEKIIARASINSALDITVNGVEIT